MCCVWKAWLPNAGETIQFNEILMLGGDAPVLGTPLVDDAAVQAEVIDEIKADKVIHFVKRRRKHSSKRTSGHRQKLTLLRVTEILASGAGKSGVKAAIGTGSVSAVGAGRRCTERSRQGQGKSGRKPHRRPKPRQRRKQAKAAPKAKPKAAPKPAEAPAAAEGVKPANLLTEAREGGPDDLKKISGVGPKLESVLHENGVFHFDQIAAWKSDEIAYMDDKLSFKGRIERDNWIEQAKTLGAEKE